VSEIILFCRSDSLATLFILAISAVLALIAVHPSICSRLQFGPLPRSSTSKNTHIPHPVGKQWIETYWGYRRNEANYSWKMLAHLLMSVCECSNSKSKSQSKLQRSHAKIKSKRKQIRNTKYQRSKDPKGRGADKQSHVVFMSYSPKLIGSTPKQTLRE